METAVPTPVHRTPETLSPVRIYLISSAIFLLVVGIGGFATSAAFPTDASQVNETSGHMFGILETNGWHNLAAVVSAVVALGFVSRPRWSRFGAFLQGTLYAAVTGAIAIWGGETFWIASNAADQVIHAALAVGGLAAAAVTKP